MPLDLTTSECAAMLCGRLADLMTAGDLRSVGCEFIEKSGHMDMSNEEDE